MEVFLKKLLCGHVFWIAVSRDWDTATCFQTITPPPPNHIFHSYWTIFPNENVSHISYTYWEQAERFTREALVNLLVRLLCSMLTRDCRIGICTQQLHSSKWLGHHLFYNQLGFIALDEPQKSCCMLQTGKKGKGCWFHHRKSEEQLYLCRRLLHLWSRKAFSGTGWERKTHI